MAKGARESKRPSKEGPKLTPISREKNTFCGAAIADTATIFKIQPSP